MSGVHAGRRRSPCLDPVSGARSGTLDIPVHDLENIIGRSQEFVLCLWYSRVGWSNNSEKYLGIFMGILLSGICEGAWLTLLEVIVLFCA